MPYFNNHIVTSGSYNAIFAIELDAGDEVLVGLHFFLLLPEIQVPYSYCFVIRGRV